MSTAPINWISDAGFNAGGARPFGGGSGSNQFFPMMPSMPMPGNTPGGGSGGMQTPTFQNFMPTSFSTATPPPFSTATAFSTGAPGTAPNQTPPGTSGQPLQFTGPPGASGMTGIGKGMFAQNPLDPALTSQLFQWLQSQIGKGVPGFDLSTILPSSGQATAPGQLNAPLNSVMQNIMALFDPSSGSLGKLASGGIDATPIWQKTVDAMQRQIAQGGANLKEQFNVEGGLASSPFGQAAVDYQTQSNKDLDSLLANMQFQGIQDQLQAAGMQTGVGQFLQGLDQQSIQNMLQEFIRTSPQYNPLLGMEFGAATTFPPVLQPQKGGGALGGLLSSLGPLLQMFSGMIPGAGA